MHIASHLALQFLCVKPIKEREVAALPRLMIRAVVLRQRLCARVAHQDKVAAHRTEPTS